MRDITRANQPVTGFTKLADLGFVTGADTLGIVPAAPTYEGVPEVAFNNFRIGSAHTTIEPDNTWHFADNFSKTYGQHSLKFGGDFRYYQVNERELCWPNGIFTFDGSETGNDFADYLLGAPVNYVQCSVQFLDLRTKYGGAYGQDSFRIRPNLTLNYGLRWEVIQPWYDTQGKIETIVPGEQSVEFPTAPKGWVVPGGPWNS
jgi:outer membrane receptor protein involved in Fe transport